MKMLTIPFVLALAGAVAAENDASQDDPDTAQLNFMQRIAALKQPGAVVLRPEQTERWASASSALSSASGSASSAVASAVQSTDENDEDESVPTTDDGKVGADEAADLVSKAWAEHATHTYDGVGTPGMIGRPTPTYTPPVGLKKKIRRSTHKRKQAHGHAHDSHAGHQLAEGLAKRNATVAAEVQQEQVANNGTTAAAAGSTTDGGLPPAHTITFNLGTSPDATAAVSAASSSSAEAESAAAPSADPSVKYQEFRKPDVVKAAKRANTDSASVQACGNSVPTAGAAAANTTTTTTTTSKKQAKTTSTKKVAPKTTSTKKAAAAKPTTTTTQQVKVVVPTTTSTTEQAAVESVQQQQLQQNDNVDTTTSTALDAAAAAAGTTTTAAAANNGRIGADEARAIASKLWAQRATHTYNGVGTPGMIGRPTPTYVVPQSGARMVKRLKEMLHVE